MAKNFIVLDTETAPTVKHHDNQAHPETSLVYDLGWVVVDGNTLEIISQTSFVIADTYCNPTLMNSAYYAKKLPQYNAGAAFCPTAAEWHIKSFLEAWQIFCNQVVFYNVKKVWAWNVRFDNIALDNTISHYSNGFINSFLPQGVIYSDVWDYVTSRLCSTKKYVKWCKNNGFTTAKGNPKTSAEIVYRYLTSQLDFIERHTANSDAVIEAEMLIKAKKAHKKGANTIGQGWRYPKNLVNAVINDEIKEMKKKQEKFKKEQEKLEKKRKQKIIENVQEYLSVVSSDYAKRIDRRFTDYKCRKCLYGEQWADEWLYLVWDYA